VTPNTWQQFVIGKSFYRRSANINVHIYPLLEIISVFNKFVEEGNVNFMKYIVAALIAIEAMLAVSAAQAAPLTPFAVQTGQAVASSGAVEKVCSGGGCGW
jgi:hypothetical protein